VFSSEKLSPGAEVTGAILEVPNAPDSDKFSPGPVAARPVVLAVEEAPGNKNGFVVVGWMGGPRSDELRPGALGAASDCPNVFVKEKG